MVRALRIAVLALLAWCCGGGLLCRAGTNDPVDVTFTAHSTLGLGPAEVRPAKTVLTEHLIELGKKGLAPGQQLHIDVIRLDLAGHLTFPRGESEAVRVLNGRADWPRIDLHYVLSSPVGVVQQGDDSLTDRNYLDHPSMRLAERPFPYEKQLLTDWFHQRFGAGSAPAH